MVQLTYSRDSQPGLAGLIADMSDRTIDSFAAQGAIDFGWPVARGTDPGKQVVRSGAANFLGVAVFSQIEESGVYPDKSTVSVMTSGRVWVVSAETVVPGNVARISAGGTFVTAGATAIVGTFLTAAAAGGLAVVQI